MGLEPTTSAVTGRRANQLRYGAIWPGRKTGLKNYILSSPHPTTTRETGGEVGTTLASPTGFEPVLPP